MMNLEINASPMAPSDGHSGKGLLLEQFELLTTAGIWEINLNRRVLSWSDGVFRILGYEPHEIEVNFDTALELIYQDDQEQFRSQYRRFIAGEAEYNLKLRLIRKDGSLIWVCSKANLIIDEETGERKIFVLTQNIQEFVQTEKKLKSARKKNRSLIESLDGIFWESDAETLECTYVSPQCEQITGYSKSEWMATKNFWEDHIHPSDRQNVLDFCRLQVDTIQDHVLNYRFLTKDQRTIWVNDRVNVVSKEGKPQKFCGMMVDITSEKATEQALQEEIALNQSLIQKLPSIFFLFDTSGRFQLWNRRLEEVSGYTSTEISAMSPEQFFSEEDRGLFATDTQVLEDGAQINRELQLLTKSGKRIPFLFSASPLTYRGKACIFGTGQNISELVESRKSAAQHIERYEKVTQATSDAIWDFDSTRNTLYWGEGFLTLFGYDPAVVEPTMDYQVSLIHPEDREKILQFIQTYLDPTSGKSNLLESYRFLKSDGTYTNVVDKSIFIRNDEGYVTRVVGAMQDISQQKEYEKSLTNLNARLEHKVHELAVSNQELEKFAFVASHDLQEPLRMISSFMGLLERKYKHVLDAKALEYISFATNGAKQMQRTILDLLELSRVGKVSEQKEALDLNLLLEELRHYLKRPITEKKGSLTFKDLPVIRTYKTPLFQIFQNLIGNAIKYSRPDVPPKITIRSRELPEAWEFSVEDNGIGIDAEYFNKIFVVFQRLHSQPDVDGNGIGLSIVKKSVDFLGGEISLESELGIGSKFTFMVKK
jgi:PAS domain S-box-containing protein